MSYQDRLRPGKRENAFYLEPDSDIEVQESLQSPYSRRIYLYEWDEKQEKVVGTWVSQENKEQSEQ